MDQVKQTSFLGQKVGQSSFKLIVAAFISHLRLVVDLTFQRFLGRYGDKADIAYLIFRRLVLFGILTVYKRCLFQNA